MRDWICIKPALVMVSMVCGIGISATAAGAEDGIIDFESDQWVKANAEVVEHLGRQCLIGTAYLQGVEFTNGIIEYDIAVDGSRSFPGITFRATSPQEYEELYIRPHSSNRADALQYTAVFSGVAGWQLYNGDGFTAAAEIPRGEWLHIRLEVLGTQARVFLDNAEVPSLVINQLKHEVVKGAVGIKSARNRSACFSNFKITATDELVFEAPPEPIIPRGIITEWQLSQPFNAFQVDRDAHPEPQLLKKITWQSVSSEPGGLVDICRFVTRSPAIPEAVFARTTLRAEQDQVLELSFGYSDSVNLFLNGKLVFSGDSTFRSRDANFVGVVGLNDTVYLPLGKGDNELMLLVVESFGGWGFIAQSRDDDAFAEGITKLWQLTTELSVPESAIYDPQRDLLYVSNFFRGGNEFISKLGLDGKIVELEWITGLDRPTGMVVRGDRLWVVDRRGLHLIDIEAGTIVAHYPASGAGFLNDVAIDDDGNAYVSDSNGSKIYHRAGEQLEVWLEGEEVDKPNGLLADGERLLFGSTGDGCLKAVDLADKQVTTIACFGDGAVMDGLRPDGQGGYIVSDYNGRTFHVSPNGATTELVNTTSSAAKSADLEYIPDLQLLIIPGLVDNRLTTYRCLTSFGPSR